MKQPLLVSCRGSEEVRSKCTPLLEKQLQSLPLQWKRIDAEFPVQIQLTVKFVPYSPTLIKHREARWQDVAAAHLYFMDCWDSEKYRLDVRSDLIEWFATLRDADTNDWLVVFDASKAKESRGRSQVLEKLRSDLSKYVSRIIEIDSASFKMPVLLRALGEQALSSFDYWAQSFELSLKAERETCFSLEWSFLNYMITQVQYSRVLLSVNIFEQSLAQLDELDAMLSLLISHYAASPTKARWIEAFCAPNPDPVELVGLIAMYSQLDDTIDQLLAEGDVYTSATSRPVLANDLRRIRALIFSCQLSVVLNRVASQTTNSETACQRIISYGAILVQAIRKEEAILGEPVDAHEPFRHVSNALWCLEVLHFAGQLCDLMIVQSESESMCTLWVTLCRMVQNMEPERMSNAVSWFPKEKGPVEQDSPVVLMEKCVLDIATFDEHFVKWHESALAMLKHYGWRRHATTIGIALAEFYRRRGKDTDALHLFLKFARQLEEERWCQAYVGLLATIADDLLHQCTLRERLKFYGDLSCAKNILPSRKSSAFYSKFRSEFDSDWVYERMPNSLGSPWFFVRRVKPARSSILCGSTLDWSVTLENRFPESVRIYSASLCCTISPGHHEPPPSSSEHRMVKPKKLIDFRRESYSVASDIADCSDLFPMDMVVENDGNGMLLPPGKNLLKFAGQCSEFGLCIPEHLHIRLGDDGRLDVQIRIVMDSSSRCIVKTVEPEVLLMPAQGDSMWAGVTQTVNFRLMVGAVPGHMGEEESNLHLQTAHDDLLLTTTSTAEDDVHGDSLVIKIPQDLAPGTTYEVHQTLFCNIHGSDENKICEVISHWRRRSFRHQLRFKPVFHWISSLRVIGERLLLTITIHNNGQRPLILHEPKLTFTSMTGESDVIAELLNNDSEQELYFAIPYTLAWYIPPACSSSGVIVFHYQFKDSSSDTYTCYADVALQKPAIVEVCCQMASEKIVCRVGMSCDFVISLKALDPSLRSVDVLVTLVFEPKFWSCTGTATELVRLKENGLGQAFFQVIPQCVGFLPMPAVEIQLTGDAAMTKTCQAYIRSKGKQVHVLAPLTNLRRSFNEQAPRKQLEIEL